MWREGCWRCLAGFGLSRPVSVQKFGNQSVEQIEHLRCKHRIRVLQGHEDTTKQNVVSRGRLLGVHGMELIASTASFSPSPSVN